MTFSNFATIADGGEMYGVLWEIDDETLKLLDAREGYPTFYKRKVVHVFYHTECYGAIAYFMASEYNTPSPPSDRYLNFIKEGYSEFDIPHTQIEEALALLK